MGDASEDGGGGRSELDGHTGTAAWDAWERAAKCRSAVVDASSLLAQGAEAVRLSMYSESFFFFFFCCVCDVVEDGVIEAWSGCRHSVIVCVEDVQRHTIWFTMCH